MAGWLAAAGPALHIGLLIAAVALITWLMVSYFQGKEAARMSQHNAWDVMWEKKEKLFKDQVSDFLDLLWPKDGMESKDMYTNPSYTAIFNKLFENIVTEPKLYSSVGFNYITDTELFTLNKDISKNYLTWMKNTNPAQYTFHGVTEEYNYNNNTISNIKSDNATGFVGNNFFSNNTDTHYEFNKNDKGDQLLTNEFIGMRSVGGKNNLWLYEFNKDLTEDEFEALFNLEIKTDTTYYSFKSTPTTDYSNNSVANDTYYMLYDNDIQEDIFPAGTHAIKDISKSIYVEIKYPKKKGIMFRNGIEDDDFNGNYKEEIYVETLNKYYEYSFKHDFDTPETIYTVPNSTDMSNVIIPFELDISINNLRIDTDIEKFDVVFDISYTKFGETNSVNTKILFDTVYTNIKIDDNKINDRKLKNDLFIYEPLGFKQGYDISLNTIWFYGRTHSDISGMVVIPSDISGEEIFKPYTGNNNMNFDYLKTNKRDELLKDCVKKGLPPPPAALGTMFELEEQISIKSLKYLKPTQANKPTINLIPTRCRNILNMNSFYNSDYSNNHSNFHEKYKGKIMVKYESDVADSTDISFTNTQFLMEDLQEHNHYRLILKLYKLQHHFFDPNIDNDISHNLFVSDNEPKLVKVEFKNSQSKLTFSEKINVKVVEDKIIFSGIDEFTIGSDDTNNNTFLTDILGNTLELIPKKKSHTFTLIPNIIIDDTNDKLKIYDDAAAVDYDKTTYFLNRLLSELEIHHSDLGKPEITYDYIEDIQTFGIGSGQTAPNKVNVKFKDKNGIDFTYTYDFNTIYFEKDVYLYDWQVGDRREYAPLWRNTTKTYTQAKDALLSAFNNHEYGAQVQVIKSPDDNLDNLNDVNTSTLEDEPYFVIKFYKNNEVDQNATKKFRISVSITNAQKKKVIDTLPRGTHSVYTLANMLKTKHGLDKEPTIVYNDSLINISIGSFDYQYSSIIYSVEIKENKNDKITINGTTISITPQSNYTYDDLALKLNEIIKENVPSFPLSINYSSYTNNDVYITYTDQKWDDDDSNIDEIVFTFDNIDNDVIVIEDIQLLNTTCYTIDQDNQELSTPKFNIEYAKGITIDDDDDDNYKLSNHMVRKVGSTKYGFPMYAYQKKIKKKVGNTVNEISINLNDDILSNRERWSNVIEYRDGTTNHFYLVPGTSKYVVHYDDADAYDNLDIFKEQKLPYSCFENNGNFLVKWKCGGVLSRDNNNKYLILIPYEISPPYAVSIKLKNDNTKNLSNNSSDFETYLLPDDICANNESSPILFNNCQVVSNKLYCTHSAGGKIMVCEFVGEEDKLIFYNMSNTIVDNGLFFTNKDKKGEKNELLLLSRENKHIHYVDYSNAMVNTFGCDMLCTNIEDFSTVTYDDISFNFSTFNVDSIIYDMSEVIVTNHGIDIEITNNIACDLFNNELDITIEMISDQFKPTFNESQCTDFIVEFSVLFENIDLSMNDVTFVVEQTLTNTKDFKFKATDKIPTLVSLKFPYTTNVNIISFKLKDIKIFNNQHIICRIMGLQARTKNYLIHKTINLHEPIKDHLSTIHMDLFKKDKSNQYNIYDRPNVKELHRKFHNILFVKNAINNEDILEYDYPLDIRESTPFDVFNKLNSLVSAPILQGRTTSEIKNGTWYCSSSIYNDAHNCKGHVDPPSDISYSFNFTKIPIVDGYANYSNNVDYENTFMRNYSGTSLSTVVDGYFNVNNLSDMSKNIQAKLKLLEPPGGFGANSHKTVIENTILDFTYDLNDADVDFKYTINKLNGNTIYFKVKGVNQHFYDDWEEYVIPDGEYSYNDLKEAIVLYAKNNKTISDTLNFDNIIFKIPENDYIFDASSIITDFDKDDITLSFTKTDDTIYNNISQYETLLKNSKLNQIFNRKYTDNEDYTDQSSNVLLYLSEGGTINSEQLKVKFDTNILFKNNTTYIFELNISKLTLGGAVRLQDITIKMNMPIYANRDTITKNIDMRKYTIEYDDTEDKTNISDFNEKIEYTFTENISIKKGDEIKLYIKRFVNKEDRGEISINTTVDVIHTDNDGDKELKTPYLSIYPVVIDMSENRDIYDLYFDISPEKGETEISLPMMRDNGDTINVSFILVKHNDNDISYYEITSADKTEIGGYVDIEFNMDVSSIMIDFTTDTFSDTSACSILIKKDSEFDNLIDISKVYFHYVFNSDTVVAGSNYQEVEVDHPYKNYLQQYVNYYYNYTEKLINEINQQEPDLELWYNSIDFEIYLKFKTIQKYINQIENLKSTNIKDISYNLFNKSMVNNTLNQINTYEMTNFYINLIGNGLQSIKEEVKKNGGGEEIKDIHTFKENINGPFIDFDIEQYNNVTIKDMVISVPNEKRHYNTDLGYWEGDLSNCKIIGENINQKDLQKIYTNNKDVSKNKFIYNSSNIKSLGCDFLICGRTNDYKSGIVIKSNHYDFIEELNLTYVEDETEFTDTSLKILHPKQDNVGEIYCTSIPCESYFMHKDNTPFDFTLNKLGLYQEFQLGSVKTESKQFVYSKNNFELFQNGTTFNLRYMTDFDDNNRGNIRENWRGKLFPELEITGIDSSKNIPNTQYTINDISQIRQNNGDIARSTYKMNNYIDKQYTSQLNNYIKGMSWDFYVEDTERFFDIDNENTRFGNRLYQAIYCGRNADPDESEYKPYDRVGTEGPLSVYRYLKELYAISNTSINVMTQRALRHKHLRYIINDPNGELYYNDNNSTNNLHLFYKSLKLWQQGTKGRFSTKSESLWTEQMKDFGATSRESGFQISSFAFDAIDDDGNPYNWSSSGKDENDEDSSPDDLGLDATPSSDTGEIFGEYDDELIPYKDTVRMFAAYFPTVFPPNKSKITDKGGVPIYKTSYYNGWIIDYCTDHPVEETYYNDDYLGYTVIPDIGAYHWSYKYSNNAASHNFKLYDSIMFMLGKTMGGIMTMTKESAAKISYYENASGNTGKLEFTHDIYEKCLLQSQYINEEISNNLSWLTWTPDPDIYGEDLIHTLPVVGQNMYYLGAGKLNMEIKDKTDEDHRFMLKYVNANNFDFEDDNIFFYVNNRNEKEHVSTINDESKDGYNSGDEKYDSPALKFNKGSMVFRINNRMWPKEGTDYNDVVNWGYDEEFEGGAEGEEELFLDEKSVYVYDQTWHNTSDNAGVKTIGRPLCYTRILNYGPSHCLRLINDVSNTMKTDGRWLGNIWTMQDTFSKHITSGKSDDRMDNSGNIKNSVWKNTNDSGSKVNSINNYYIIKKHSEDLNISRLYFENYGLLDEDGVEKLAIPVSKLGEGRDLVWLKDQLTLYQNNVLPPPWEYYINYSSYKGYTTQGSIKVDYQPDQVVYRAWGVVHDDVQASLVDHDGRRQFLLRAMPYSASSSGENFYSRTYTSRVGITDTEEKKGWIDLSDANWEYKIRGPSNFRHVPVKNIYDDFLQECEDWRGYSEKSRFTQVPGDYQVYLVNHWRFDKMFEPYNCYPVNAAFSGSYGVSRIGINMRDTRWGDEWNSEYITHMIDRKLRPSHSINYFRSTTGIQCADGAHEFYGDFYEFSRFELYAENTSYFLSDHIYYDKVTNIWTQIDRNKQYEYETTFHSDISYAGCYPSKNDSGKIDKINGAIIDNYTGIATLKQSIIETETKGVNEPNNYNHKYRFDRSHMIPGGNGVVHTGNYEGLYVINVANTYTYEQDIDENDDLKKAIQPPKLYINNDTGGGYWTEHGNVSYKYAVRSKPPERNGCVRYKVMGSNIAVVDSRETGVKYTGQYNEVYEEDEEQIYKFGNRITYDTSDIFKVSDYRGIHQQEYCYDISDSITKIFINPVEISHSLNETRQARFKKNSNTIVYPTLCLNTLVHDGSTNAVDQSFNFYLGGPTQTSFDINQDKKNKGYKYYDQRWYFWNKHKNLVNHHHKFYYPDKSQYSHYKNDLTNYDHVGGRPALTFPKNMKKRIDAPNGSYREIRATEGYFKLKDEIITKKMYFQMEYVEKYDIPSIEIVQNDDKDELKDIVTFENINSDISDNGHKTYQFDMKNPDFEYNYNTFTSVDISEISFRFDPTKINSSSSNINNFNTCLNFDLSYNISKDLSMCSFMNCYQEKIKRDDVYEYEDIDDNKISNNYDKMFWSSSNNDISFNPITRETPLMDFYITIVEDENDKITIGSKVIQMNNGTYTISEFATHLKDKINAGPPFIDTIIVDFGYYYPINDKGNISVSHHSIGSGILTSHVLSFDRDDDEEIVFSGNFFNEHQGIFLEKELGDVVIGGADYYFKYTKYTLNGIEINSSNNKLQINGGEEREIKHGIYTFQEIATKLQNVINSSRMVEILSFKHTGNVEIVFTGNFNNLLNPLNKNSVDDAMDNVGDYYFSTKTTNNNWDTTGGNNNLIINGETIIIPDGTYTSEQIKNILVDKLSPKVDVLITDDSLTINYEAEPIKNFSIGQGDAENNTLLTKVFETYDKSTSQSSHTLTFKDIFFERTFNFGSMILSPMQIIDMDITVEGTSNGIVEITPYIEFEPKYVYQQLHYISNTATHHDYFPSYDKIRFNIKNYLDLPKFRHMDGTRNPYISSEQQYLTMYDTSRNGDFKGVSLMNHSGICLEMNHEEPHKEPDMTWTYPKLYQNHNDLSKNFNLISKLQKDPSIEDQTIKIMIGGEPYNLRESISSIYAICQKTRIYNPLERKFVTLGLTCINYMTLKFDVTSTSNCKIKFLLNADNENINVSIKPIIKLRDDLFYNQSETLYREINTNSFINEPINDLKREKIKEIKESIIHTENFTSIDLTLNPTYDVLDPSFANISKNGAILHSHYKNNSYTLNLYKNLYDIKNRLIHFLFKKNDKEKILNAKLTMDAILAAQKNNDYSKLIESISFEITTNFTEVTKYLERTIFTLTTSYYNENFKLITSNNNIFKRLIDLSDNYSFISTNTPLKPFLTLDISLNNNNDGPQKEYKIKLFKISYDLLFNTNDHSIRSEISGTEKYIYYTIKKNDKTYEIKFTENAYYKFIGKINDIVSYYDTRKNTRTDINTYISKINGTSQLNHNMYYNKGVLKFLNKDPLEIKFLKGGADVNGDKMIFSYDIDKENTYEGVCESEHVVLPEWKDENTLKSNNNIYHGCLNKEWPQKLTYTTPKQLLTKKYTLNNNINLLNDDIFMNMSNMESDERVKILYNKGHSLVFEMRDISCNFKETTSSFQGYTTDAIMYVDDDVEYDEETPNTTNHLKDISNVFHPKYNLYLGYDDEIEVSCKLNLLNLNRNIPLYNVNNNIRFIENIGIKIDFKGVDTPNTDNNIDNCDLSFNFNSYLAYQKPNLNEDCYFPIYIYKTIIEDNFNITSVVGEPILNPEYDINQSILISNRKTIGDLSGILDTFYNDLITSDKQTGINEYGNELYEYMLPAKFSSTINIVEGKNDTIKINQSIIKITGKIYTWRELVLELQSKLGDYTVTIGNYKMTISHSNSFTIGAVDTDDNKLNNTFLTKVLGHPLELITASKSHTFDLYSGSISIIKDSDLNPVPINEGEYIFSLKELYNNYKVILDAKKFFPGPDISAVDTTNSKMNMQVVFDISYDGLADRIMQQTKLTDITSGTKYIISRNCEYAAKWDSTKIEFFNLHDMSSVKFGGEPEKISATNVESVDISPDNRYVLYTAGSKLYIHDFTREYYSIKDNIVKVLDISQTSNAIFISNIHVLYKSNTDKSKIYNLDYGRDSDEFDNIHSIHRIEHMFNLNNTHEIASNITTYPYGFFTNDSGLNFYYVSENTIDIIDKDNIPWDIDYVDASPQHTYSSIFNRSVKSFNITDYKIIDIDSTNNNLTINGTTIEIDNDTYYHNTLKDKLKNLMVGDLDTIDVTYLNDILTFTSDGSITFEGTFYTEILDKPLLGTSFNISNYDGTIDATNGKLTINGTTITIPNDSYDKNELKNKLQNLLDDEDTLNTISVIYGDDVLTFTNSIGGDDITLDDTFYTSYSPQYITVDSNGLSWNYLGASNRKKFNQYIYKKFSVENDIPLTLSITDLKIKPSAYKYCIKLEEHVKNKYYSNIRIIAKNLPNDGTTVGIHDIEMRYDQPVADSRIIDEFRDTFDESREPDNRIVDISFVETVDYLNRNSFKEMSMDSFNFLKNGVGGIIGLNDKSPHDISKCYNNMIGNIGYNDKSFAENWINSTIVTRNYILNEYEIRENNIIEGSMGLPMGGRGGFWNPTSVTHAVYQRESSSGKYYRFSKEARENIYNLLNRNNANKINWNNTLDYDKSINDIPINIMDIYEDIEENIEIEKYNNDDAIDYTSRLLKKKSNEMRIFPFDVLFSILYKIRNKCHVGGLVGYLDLHIIGLDNYVKLKEYENMQKLKDLSLNYGIDSIAKARLDYETFDFLKNEVIVNDNIDMLNYQPKYSLKEVLEPPPGSIFNPADDQTKKAMIDAIYNYEIAYSESEGTWSQTDLVEYFLNIITQLTMEKENRENEIQTAFDTIEYDQKFKMYETTSSIVGDIFNNGIQIVKDIYSVDSDFYGDISGFHEIKNTACGLYGFIQTRDMIDDTLGYEKDTVEISNNSVVNLGKIKTNITEWTIKPTLASLYPFSYKSTNTFVENMSNDISYNYAIFQPNHYAQYENTGITYLKENNLETENELERVVFGVKDNVKVSFKTEHSNLEYIDDFIILDENKYVLFKTTTFIKDEPQIKDKIIINTIPDFINILFSNGVSYETNYWSIYETYLNTNAVTTTKLTDGMVIFIIFLEKLSSKQDFGEPVFRKHKFKKIHGDWKILLNNDTNYPVDFNRSILSTPFTKYYTKNSDGVAESKFSTYQYQVSNQSIVNGWHFINAIDVSYNGLFIDAGLLNYEIINKSELDSYISNDANIITKYLTYDLSNISENINYKPKHDIINKTKIEENFTNMSIEDINKLLDLL
tara:strand:- start:11633 stop:32140 length:20508 start_codon:yes stop_codon:yes gene_type:complete